MLNPRGVSETWRKILVSIKLDFLRGLLRSSGHLTSPLINTLKDASVSSILSTPIQRFREHPNLIKELEAFKRRSWWPEVSSLPDITTNWLAQPRIFNRLPLISSLSKDNFCLLWCLLNRLTFKSLHPLHHLHWLFLWRMERVFKSFKNRGRQEVMPPPPLGNK